MVAGIRRRDDGAQRVGDGEHAGAAPEARVLGGEGRVDGVERGHPETLERLEERGVRGADDGEAEALEHARDDEGALAAGAERLAQPARDELGRRGGAGQHGGEVALAGPVAGAVRQVGAEHEQAAVGEGGAAARPM